ncbi:hypothetical protein [Alishewanella longhuensis]
MTFRVLFIDDDAFMLKALLRTAKRLRPHWLFYGCEQAKDWVSLAEEIAPLDMIICDYQMPEINGEQVLRQATISYPAAVRVLLQAILLRILLPECANLAIILSVSHLLSKISLKYFNV